MSIAASRTGADRMDRHYRFQRWIYDATRTYFLIGRNTLIRSLAPPHGGKVLEIGCGTAWNLARLAGAYPDARLFGVDVSEAMLETARRSLARKRLQGHVVLRQGCATSFAPERLFGIEAFERIVFSYALSMIPAWERALDHAASMLAKGGELHIVDFGQCDRLPQATKGMLFAFLQHYSVTPQSGLRAYAEMLAAKHGLVCEFRSLHRGYTEYAVLSRPK